VIPTIFSPNGDGVNDTFYLPHVCDVSPFAMHIYNKWGELVFECQDINQGWDGKYKGEKQSEGVYWLWLMLTPGNTTIYKSATVTLVR
jgi:gliding motility-associated-like protein